MSNFWFYKGRNRILGAIEAGDFKEATTTVDVGIDGVIHTNPRGAFLTGIINGLVYVLAGAREHGFSPSGKRFAGDLDAWAMRAEAAMHRRPDHSAAARGQPSPLTEALVDGMRELKACLDAGLKITAAPGDPGAAAKVDLSEVVRGPDGLITGVIKRPVSAAVAIAALRERSNE